MHNSAQYGHRDLDEAASAEPATRREVILRLGEPDVVGPAGEWAAYIVDHAKGSWVGVSLFFDSATTGPFNKPWGETRIILFAFGPDGAVARQGVRTVSINPSNETVRKFAEQWLSEPAPERQ
jgi:hypothetical protein